MWGRDGHQSLSTEKNLITWGHSVQGQRGPPQKDNTESPGRFEWGAARSAYRGRGKTNLNSPTQMDKDGFKQMCSEAMEAL